MLIVNKTRGPASPLSGLAGALPRASIPVSDGKYGVIWWSGISSPLFLRILVLVEQGVATFREGGMESMDLNRKIHHCRNRFELQIKMTNFRVN